MKLLCDNYIIISMQKTYSECDVNKRNIFQNDPICFNFILKALPIVKYSDQYKITFTFCC